jgi:hypothetical protein
MTISAVNLEQISDSLAVLRWEADSLPTLLGWELTVNEDGGGQVIFGSPLEVAWIEDFLNLCLYYPINHMVAGQTLQFSVEDNSDLAGQFGSNEITLADLTLPYTYGPVSYLATTARYTTVAAVKERLAIETADTSRDADILSAIIASELALDIFMHRSFPDTGENPQIPGVPDGIAQAALQTAIATWKEADAPTGSSGSEAFMGALSVSQTTRTMIQQSAVLVGLRVGFGTG